MNKYRYLFKNIGILTISNFGTKILSFILIPLYTSALSTVDYGTYDIYITTISLLIPLLTFNIIESVMRFSLESKNDKGEVFIVGFKRILSAIILITFLIIFNNIFKFINIFTLYPVAFILLFSFSLIYDFLIQFSRGIEKVGDVAIAGVLNAIVMLGLNVVFLLFFKTGLDGYFIANITAYIIPCIYLVIKIKIWKFYPLQKENKVLKKEMYSYSKPLIFNTLAWWINNVSDRYIVTWICGLAENGIYSIAYKIPTFLNVFQSIFSQAWAISAVKEFNDDSTKFYTKVYQAYNCGMVIVCSLLIILDKVISRILFSNDFFRAWEYAPFLMVSVVFGSLSGLLGGIFSAAKDAKAFAYTTMFGAAVNTILNVILVKFFGPMGAAIATVISYYLVWVARYKKANEIVMLEISLKRDKTTYAILIIQIIVLLYLKGVVLYFWELFFFIIILVLYKNDLKNIIINFKKIVK